MRATNTAKDIFASIAPKAIALGDLGVEVVIPVTLDPSYERGFAALYRGSIDEAGSIIASAYLGHDSGSLAGLEAVRSIGGVGFNRFESQHQTRKGVVKFAWGEPDASAGGSFVVITIPERMELSVPVLDKNGKVTVGDDGAPVEVPRVFRLSIE